jgi:CheY-like chemotaxis protein
MATADLIALVTGDHAESVDVVAEILRRNGQAVRTANSYVSAIRTARSVRVDVLVVVAGLSDGDYCDLLREIRRIYPVKSVAIAATRQAAARYRRGGFERVLSGPASPESMAEAVRSVTGPHFEGNGPGDDGRAHDA